jgi:hypothetical protein
MHFHTKGGNMASNRNNTCTLIDRFSLPERVVMRLGWYGFMAVATYGIFKQSPGWAVIYVAYSVLSFALVVLPGLCSHCPFPSKHGTCLFLPPGLISRFYPYKGPRMHPLSKIAVPIVLVGMALVPHIWLVSDPPLLILFWLLGLPTIAAIPLHYCRRCRHFDCPLNKAVDPEDSLG